jgi:outer membrane biosynthesis protein TonB
MKSNDNFFVCLSFSIAIHLLAIYVFLFGLPSFQNKYQDELEDVITFEMLPIAAISNVPTQQKSLEKAIENETAKEVKQSKPKEEPKPVEEPKLEKPLEKEEPKADAETIVKAKDADPKKAEPEKKKPTPVQEPKKKEPKKKLPTTNDLDSLLKNLEASSQGSDAKSAKRALAQNNDALNNSKGPFNAALALSISEQNLIKQQIQKHWNIPLAAQNIEKVGVTLHIELDKDGTVTNVKIIDKTCPNVPNSVCQALANSAERAVWQASPLTNLPQGNYNKWKEFNLTFYPNNAM